MQQSLIYQASLARARMKELGLTQQDVADALGIEQSKISRLLAGKFKRQSPSFERLCRHLKIGVSSNISSGLDQELHLAISEVWDGTKEHASALAKVIRTIGQLRRT